jgi:hypothetical protein
VEDEEGSLGVITVVAVAIEGEVVEVKEGEGDVVGGNSLGWVRVALWVACSG